MKHVYLIRSLKYPDQRYIGVTADLDSRLKRHNTVQSPHTSQFAPWEIVTSIAFEDDAKAEEFERYLKTGSGRAFANKHLL